MGKAQSKRSVDITTENKKNADDEITEKLEKIEDLDKKDAVNGDATLEEKQDVEKKDSNEVENDKDMTTEKNVDIQPSGDSAESSNSVERQKEEAGSATAEEISPLADESIKKPKKEKVKKKWSFRNISFGKKDKQKPTKNEEAVEDETTTTNGPEIDEKSLKETDASQKEKSSNEIKGNSAESRENGDASQQELNGTEHHEGKPFEEKSNDLTTNMTNHTTSEKSGTVQSENTVESSDVSEKTEVMAVTTTINIETNLSEMNSTVGVVKSDNGNYEESNATKQESQKVNVTNASNETSIEKASTLSDATNELSAPTNGEVFEKNHQNGDNIDQEVVEQSKAQIEVNFNTDNKVSAATLDTFPSTSINPSKAQIHNQDLNTTTKNADEFVEISYEETDVLKLTDNTIEDPNEQQTPKDVLLSTNIIEIKESAAIENISDEPSPPPLPISPPPSQVSVFAFTNNKESVKDSISTKNIESVCPSIEENNKVLSSLLEVIPDNNINYIPEINDQFEDTTKNNNNELNKKVHDNILEKPSCIFKEELQENTVLNNFGKNEEFSIAAEVIDEITDKAVEIISIQSEPRKHIQESNSLQKNELEKDYDEDITSKTGLGVENIVHHKEFAEGNNASECKKSELTKYSLEPTVALNHTQDTITKSSLVFSASDVIQQAQNDTLFLRVEEHLIPTKEFGNAKDLKDNAAAAEITKELSVTCE